MNTRLLLERIKPRFWWQRSKWRLMEDFKSECGITIPAGFVSDGLSIPFYARYGITPTGLGFRAALVHDYLLSQGYSWEHSNERFEAQLEHDDVPYWLRKMYVLGVELWAKLKG